MDKSTNKALYGVEGLIGAALVLYSAIISNVNYVLDQGVSTSVLSSAPDVIDIWLVGSGTVGFVVLLIGTGFIVNAVAGYYSVD